jgi:ABC-type transport system involved in multi-copper enzyme maturation permease subunit
MDLEAGCFRLFRLNPCVARHELRLRMRGTRVYWVLFAYAGIAAATFLIALWVTAWQGNQMGGPGLRQPDLGRIVLTVLAYTQLVLVLLILPAYSAGAITMEREKRTIEMLRATLLSPSDVVTGKLFVVLSLGVLLLLSSLPIGAWSLLLGGVAPEEVAMIYSYLLALAIFASALGMLFSAFLGRSLGAVVGVYGLLLGLLIVPFVVLMIAFSSTGSTLPAMGRTWGVATIGAVGLAIAWLMFLALRWAWQRMLGRRLRRLGAPVAAVVALAALGLALWPGGAVMTEAAKLKWGWYLVVEPYMTLAGLIWGGEVIQVFTGYGSSVGSSPISAQFLVWAVGTALSLLGAVGCWAAAVRVYRVRG